jgi:hypothetical protein
MVSKTEQTLKKFNILSVEYKKLWTVVAAFLIVVFQNIMVETWVCVVCAALMCHMYSIQNSGAFSDSVYFKFNFVSTVYQRKCAW